MLISIRSICCVFRPAFRCCTHLKAGRNLFFQPFSSFFCSIFTFFSDFTPEINKNGPKMNKKSNVFSKYHLLRKAGRHAKAGRLPEGVPRICLFSVDFLPFQTFFSDFWQISDFFCWFFTFFNKNRVKIEKINIVFYP